MGWKIVRASAIFVGAFAALAGACGDDVDALPSSAVDGGSGDATLVDVAARDVADAASPRACAGDAAACPTTQFCASDGTCKPAVAVAWTSSSHDVYLRVWSGDAWTELGGSGSGGGISRSGAAALTPSAAVLPDGTPIVAWGEAHVLHVARWDGATWAISTFASPGDQFESTSLAVDSAGNALIAWSTFLPTDQPGNSYFCVYVRQWDGATWQELAGSGSACAASKSTPRTRPSTRTRRSITASPS